MGIHPTLLVIGLLLAGCAAPTLTSSSNPSSASNTSGAETPGLHVVPPPSRSATSGAGLQLDGTARDGASVNVLARNQGDATQVGAGCQATPWQERVEDADGRILQIRRPQPARMCPDYLAPFPHGAQAWFNATWNGTQWHADDGAGAFGPGAYVAAPPGSYTWVVSFRTEADREGPATELRFPLALS